MEFPYKPLWINVFVKNNAKVNVPLLWSRVQVTCFSILFSALFVIVNFVGGIFKVSFIMNIFTD